MKYGTPLILNDFRSAINNYPEESRLQHFGNSSSDEVQKNRRRYAREKIIPDIEWSEMMALPGALFLLDFLAIVDEQDVREEIAQISCRDGSGQILIGAKLESWTQVPLIFLLVHCTDWLTPERMEELEKTTNRMRLLMAEIKKYGKDSPKHLDEIMESVLRQMPENERFDYFVKCFRLRDYVKGSANEDLRQLLPDDLPSPPGPPENMRTWTVNGQTFEGILVSLDPIKQKVLTLIDEDGMKFMLMLLETSQEDKEYVRSLLEKEQNETE